jgi:hypothetical protein
VTQSYRLDTSVVSVLRELHPHGDLVAASTRLQFGIKAKNV